MNQQVFISQLKQILDTFESIKLNLADQNEFERQKIVTSAVAAVHRITGNNSTYSREINEVKARSPKYIPVKEVLGIVQALKDDLEKGNLRSLSEIIHSEVFADFLEMAEHLAEKNFKDPAAVLAGSTLESHLKKLAEKNNIPWKDDSDNPIKAARINDELKKAGVYETLDHKSIIFWLGLRNDAAHGDYHKYSVDQVKLLILGVRDFINRNPA
jgi:hypothetical protein